MTAARSIDVLSVGEALVDFVAPDADDLAAAGTFIRSSGGAPANVAVAAARLGARSALVGAVGDDAFGRFLRDTLQANDVDIAALLSVPAHTTLAFVARNTGGIPDFVFYRGADAALAPEHIPAETVARSRFVHLSSMALLSEPSRSATLAAAAAAHAAGAVVSVDPNLRPSSWPSVEEARAAIIPLVQTADILKVNDAEATLLTGSEQPRAALELLGNEETLVVITLGADGCLWRYGDAAGEIAAPAVQVVETTGAGDAFVGAVLARLSTHPDVGPGLAGMGTILVEVLQFAAAAGALACTRTGAMASLPTVREVEQLLAR